MERIKELFNKYKEVISFLFFGGCTFVVSIASFYVLNRVMLLNEHIANVISWILAVSFAYITNKIFVFNSKTRDFKGLTKEILSFFSARLLTLGMEEIILFVGVDLMNVDTMLVKIVGQIVVIISNYFLSKLFIFKK